MNAITKKVHRFPDEFNRPGSCDTPYMLGWTGDSRNLALSVPEYVDKDSIIDKLVLCPLDGGKCVWVADITGYCSSISWLPR